MAPDLRLSDAELARQYIAAFDRLSRLRQAEAPPHEIAQAQAEFEDLKKQLFAIQP